VDPVWYPLDLADCSLEPTARRGGVESSHDSPLEGDGFEPSVPGRHSASAVHRISSRAPLARRIRARTMRSAMVNGVVPIAAAQRKTSRVMAPMRDRSEHRVWPVIDGFLVEIDDAAGIRQIVRHEHDAAYRQRCVVPHLRKLVVGTAADNAAA